MFGFCIVVPYEVINLTEYAYRFLLDSCDVILLCTAVTAPQISNKRLPFDVTAPLSSSNKLFNLRLNIVLAVTQFWPPLVAGLSK